MSNQTRAGLQTSRSNPSLKPISNRTDSLRLAESRGTGHRRALRKSSTERQKSMDRDFPIPLGNATTNQHARDPTDVAEDGHNHFYSWRLPISKVRPAVLDVEDSTTNAVPSKEPYSAAHHFHTSHPATSKVRPAAAGSPQSGALHEGHGRVSKVRSHPSGPANDQSRQLEASMPNGDIESSPRDKGEPEKKATFWGYLPRFGENRNEQPQTGSRKVSTDAQLSSAESQSQQENRFKGDQLSKHPSPIVGLPQRQFMPSIAQTTGWLRGLLRLSETDDLPRRNSGSGDVASQMSTHSDNDRADLGPSSGTSQHSRVSHLDDANLPLTPTSGTSIRTASAHESSISGGSEHYEDGRSGTPSRVVKRVRGHSQDDGCVLPLPPLNRKLDRHSSHSWAWEPDDDEVHSDMERRSRDVPNSRQVRKYIRTFHQPPISVRSSSKSPERVPLDYEDDSSLANRLSEIKALDKSVHSLDGGTSDEVVDFSTQYQYDFGEMKEGGDNMGGKNKRSGLKGLHKSPGNSKEGIVEGRKTDKKGRGHRRQPPKRHLHELQNINLDNKSHVSIDDTQRFSLTKAAKRQPTIARD
ncbi:hypothetical protein F5Y17DRAFT_64071 [Xylariaceae sp. FL0594]|nr:hypothetical protein F5Y17DRAFT_64071 [Xylariaceae sp. FL0594]